MFGCSEADPDAGLETSPDDFLEWFQHHHRLATVVHLFNHQQLVSSRQQIKLSTTATKHRSLQFTPLGICRILVYNALRAPKILTVPD